MRVATWNVNSVGARLARLEEWLALWEPDVLCLQETKCADDAFPSMALKALGYDVAHHGEGQWNGVAIASRVGISDVKAGFDDDDDDYDEARIIWATCGDVRVGSVYVPNGRALDDPHYAYKLEFLDRLHGHLQRHESPEAALLLCGDMNIAPEDRDVWDPSALEGATHVSEPERERFRSLIGWGLVDCFRQQYQDSGLYTWWDYRGGNFHKRMGMRIDHMLATRGLAKSLQAMLIDREARKGKGPSDHAPIVADFNLPAGER